MNGVIRPRAAFLSGTAVCFVVAVLLSSTTAWAQEDQASPIPGCSLEGVSEAVTSVFGAFDRSMHNGGAPQAAPIPGVKMAPPKVTTCVFQRTNAREALQVISNQYGTSQGASGALQGMAKVKHAQGPFYTSDAEKGGVQMHQGPGRLAALSGNQVVIVHWLVSAAGRLRPEDVLGDRLTPIALAALRQ